MKDFAPKIGGIVHELHLARPLQSSRIPAKIPNFPITKKNGFSLRSFHHILDPHPSRYASKVMIEHYIRSLQRGRHKWKEDFRSGHNHISPLPTNECEVLLYLREYEIRLYLPLKDHI